MRWWFHSATQTRLQKWLMSDLSAQMCHTLIPKLVSLVIHTEVLLLYFYCSDLSTHFTRDPFWSNQTGSFGATWSFPFTWASSSINSFSLFNTSFFLSGFFFDSLMCFFFFFWASRILGFEPAPGYVQWCWPNSQHYPSLICAENIPTYSLELCHPCRNHCAILSL